MSYQVAILCGGLGTRLREETEIKPKPMVAIGGRPILWHIMKIYAAHGFKDFILCLGYKGEVIREYFLNYKLQNADTRVNLRTGSVEIVSREAELPDWTVTLVDTGVDSRAITYRGGGVPARTPASRGPRGSLRLRMCARVRSGVRP